MWILALEASTTSAKAMLFDTDTDTFSERVKAYGTMHPNELLHDAEKVFACMAEVGRDLAEGKDVSIVSLCGAWHSVMLCDHGMNPITPVYPWSYTGATEICRELRRDSRFVNEYYRRTGCMVNATYPLFKLLHLRNQGYKLEDYYIMEQGSYNNYRLTGKKVTSRCLASGSGLLNIHTREYDIESLKLIGIKESQLPRLAESEQTCPLSEEGASILGLKPGIPVVLTNSDGGLNQIGAGAIQGNIMTFSVGTSGAMRVSTKKPVIPKTPSTWCYLSPKGWMSGAATAGCCNCIDWFIDHVMEGRVHYEQLESDINDILDTPIFLPLLFGERCPGWNDEPGGGFSHLKASHMTADLYRGIQQGILFHLYQCYRLLVEIAKEPERVKLSGGILHSPTWTQMCADIFGKTLEVNDSTQGSLMGAVVLAREIMGDLSEIEKYEPHIKMMVEPNKERHILYEEQFEKYMGMYREMK